MHRSLWLALALAVAHVAVACRAVVAPPLPPTPANPASSTCSGSLPLRTPLIRSLFTADPSAHVFDGKLYVYPSHDLESNPARQ